MTACLVTASSSPGCRWESDVTRWGLTLLMSCHSHLHRLRTIILENWKAGTPTGRLNSAYWFCCCWTSSALGSNPIGSFLISQSKQSDSLLTLVIWMLFSCCCQWRIISIRWTHMFMLPTRTDLPTLWTKVQSDMYRVCSNSFINLIFCWSSRTLWGKWEKRDIQI